MLKKLNKYFNISIVIAIIFAALGIILMSYPDISFNAISYCIAGILIINGLVLFVIDYKTYSLFVNTFFYAILSIIGGVLVLIHPNALKMAIPICLGIWFIAGGLFKLRFSAYLRDSNTFYSVLSVIANIITIICGVILLMNPIESVEIVTVSMGIILLVYSIADLIDMIVIKKNVNGISRFIKDEVSRFKELD